MARHPPVFGNKRMSAFPRERHLPDLIVQRSYLAEWLNSRVSAYPVMKQTQQAQHMDNTRLHQQEIRVFAEEDHHQKSRPVEPGLTTVSLSLCVGSGSEQGGQKTAPTETPADGEFVRSTSITNMYTARLQ